MSDCRRIYCKRNIKHAIWCSILIISCCLKEFLEEQDSCTLPLYLTCNRHTSLSISTSLGLIFRSPQTLIKARIIMRRIMHIYNIGALMPQLIPLRYQRAELKTLIALWRFIHHLWYEEWHNEGLYRRKKKWAWINVVRDFSVHFREAHIETVSHKMWICQKKEQCVGNDTCCKSQSQDAWVNWLEQ